MLPFGLRIAWFTLSLSGLLSSWVALPAFISHAQSLWLPVLYSIANTVLQGMFCLGMIWKMDPSLMPHAFCEAQTALIHAAWTSIAGVCLLSTSSAAKFAHTGPLQWFPFLNRYDTHIRIIFLGVLPALVFVLQLAILSGLNVDIAADGVFCDASNPAWVRLLGYAGIIPFIAIPSLCLSAAALVLALRNLLSQRTDSDFHDNFTPLPTSHRSRQSSRAFTPESRSDGSQATEHVRAASAPILTPSRQSLRSQTPSFYAIPSRSHTPSLGRSYHPPGRARITVTQYKYHLPSYYLSPHTVASDEEAQARSPSAEPMTESRGSQRSHISPSISPATFAPPSETGSTDVPSRNASRGTTPALAFPEDLEKRIWRQQTANINAVFARDGIFQPDPDDTVSGSIKWTRYSLDSSGPKSELEFARTTQDDLDDDFGDPRCSPITYPTPVPYFSDPYNVAVRHRLLFTLFYQPPSQSHPSRPSSTSSPNIIQPSGLKMWP
ncbi:hypothetical protein QCA50_013877 [Cerrena zonata]|uniref:Uncharacterized protein n=1 Tax=Cerrena zonata TaxID=2478898 RepID=A0AAW0FUN1_9APHY